MTLKDQRDAASAEVAALEVASVLFVCNMRACTILHESKCCCDVGLTCMQGKNAPAMAALKEADDAAKHKEAQCKATVPADSVFPFECVAYNDIFIYCVCVRSLFAGISLPQGTCTCTRCQFLD